MVAHEKKTHIINIYFIIGYSSVSVAVSVAVYKLIVLKVPVVLILHYILD